MPTTTNIDRAHWNDAAMRFGALLDPDNDADRATLADCPALLGRDEIGPIRRDDGMDGGDSAMIVAIAGVLSRASIAPGVAAVAACAVVATMMDAERWCPATEKADAWATRLCFNGHDHVSGYREPDESDYSAAIGMCVDKDTVALIKQARDDTTERGGMVTALAMELSSRRRLMPAAITEAASFVIGVDAADLRDGETQWMWAERTARILCADDHGRNDDGDRSQPSTRGIAVTDNHNGTNTVAQPPLWFICNPRKPDEVFVTDAHGQRSVLAYSDDRQAIAGCLRHKLADDDDAIMLMEMPVEDAATWLLRFPDRHGVEQLVLDEGSGQTTWNVRAYCETLRAATGA